jgi:DNA-binding transcriptional ArsR family regulator
VFSDPLRRRLVLHLIGRERSLAEIAADTGLDLKRLHYHATVLTELGLLMVAHEKKRAGRPIKMYRASAKAFFVPDDAAHSGPAEVLTAELRRSLAKQRARSHAGIVYHMGEDGEPRMQSVQRSPAKGMPAVEHWRVLRLSRLDAERLSKEIEDRFQAYADRHDDLAESFLVHFALAPSSVPMMRGLPGVTKRP